MAVGVATATAAATAVITDHHSEATNTKYTSAIDQYNNQLFSVKTKEVKYQWGQVTKIRKGGTPISVTLANAETILDIFKDRATQYGFRPYHQRSHDQNRNIRSPVLDVSWYQLP